MNNQELIVLLEEIKEKVSSLVYQDEIGKDKIIHRLEMIIRNQFGVDSHYLYEVLNNDFSDYSIIISDDFNEHRNAWEVGKQKLITVIDTIVEEMKLFANAEVEKTETHKLFKKIFIVHGHDNEMVQESARFITKLGFEPVILREQPSKGKTIIEKFENYSDVDFAIVLFSPDDFGRAKEDKKDHPRPRQNVVFELGFFIGKLGRQSVVVLHKVIDDFEIFSDFQGVIFHPFQKGWEMDVAKEIKSVGFNVDTNKLF